MTKTSTLEPTVQVPVALPGSSLPGIHKDRGPLRRALLDLPEWVAALDELNWLEAMRPPVRNLASLDVEMEVLLTDAVDKREPIDLDEALAHAAKVQNHLAGHQAFNRAFEQVAEGLVRRLDATVRTNRSRIYASLSRQLNDLVQRTRELVDVFGLDAEAAIAAGKTEQWRELQSLRAECRVLRAARGTLEQGLGWAEDHILGAGYFELRWCANPAEVYEHRRAWRVDGHLVNPANPDDRKPLVSPWPDPRTERIPVAEEADGWLSFLARTPNAVPWIPTPEQFTAAAKGLFHYADAIRATEGSRSHIEPPPSPVTYGENTRRPARDPRAAWQ